MEAGHRAKGSDYFLQTDKLWRQLHSVTTPAAKSKGTIQIDLSPSSGRVRQYYCRFELFSEGTFFSVFFLEKVDRTKKFSNFQNRRVRVGPAELGFQDNVISIDILILELIFGFC